MAKVFSVNFRVRQSYKGRGEWARIARMKNDYAIQVYFDPKARYAAIRKSGLHKKGRVTSYRGAIGVGELAQKLMVDGIPMKRTGKRGRPGLKRWPVAENLNRRNSRGKENKYRRSWREFVAKIGLGVFSGKYRSVREGYYDFARGVAVDFQRAMYETLTPALEERTIKIKGSSHPLFETFKMFNAVRSKVVIKSSLSGGKASKTYKSNTQSMSNTFEGLKNMFRSVLRSGVSEQNGMVILRRDNKETRNDNEDY